MSGRPDRALPALRLEVDQIKAQSILLDDAVDPFVTRFRTVFSHTRFDA
jgi:hypothetical protein